jgi:hypothetical protein
VAWGVPAVTRPTQPRDGFREDEGVQAPCRSYVFFQFINATLPYIVDEDLGGGGEIWVGSPAHPLEAHMYSKFIRLYVSLYW